MIIRILTYVLVTILTSFYFFPFEFTFIPGINTKMMMAVVGLFFLVFNQIQNRRQSIDRRFLILSLLAIIVGLVSLISMVYNTTPDNSYLTYVVSVWVWCSAAYAVINIIKIVHGELTFRLISNYIIAVCVTQTTLAFSMQFIPPLKAFVDSFLAGEGFMGKNVNRLYGVGAALDPSGLRFSCVLILIMYLIIHTDVENKVMTWIYIVSYGVIFVFGNMMSRTTIVGASISLILLFLNLFIKSNDGDEEKIGALGMLRRLFFVVAVIVPVMAVLYNTNSVVRENLRFGFEGFFALAEEGRWHTTSSDGLENHWMFPQDLDSWIIGDGYIASTNIDENYIGVEYAGYYMGTDIGYCRFIFYFGVCGLLVMMTFFVYLTVSCADNHHKQAMLFFCFLLVNLIGWCKVSSDVIMIFLPYLFFQSKGIDDRSALDKE